ncbi:hypothetical protein ACSBR2_030618 [Camellia fascicularis]
MSLVIGARRHLEWGHEKYIIDMIQSHPAQTRNATRLVASAIAKGLGALTHTLGTLVPVIAASEFATAATTIRTVVGNFR